MTRPAFTQMVNVPYDYHYAVGTNDEPDLYILIYVPKGAGLPTAVSNVRPQLWRQFLSDFTSRLSSRGL